MKYILTLILSLPFILSAQINDDWDAVKVGSNDMQKIYVGADLVWQNKVLEYAGNGGITVTPNYLSSITANYPLGLVSGDLLVFIAWLKDGDTLGGYGIPSGWTVAGVVNVDLIIYAWVFVKESDGTESGTATFSHSRSPNDGGAGIIYNYTASDLTLPVSGNAMTTSSGSSASYTSPTIASGSAGIVVVPIFGDHTISKTSGTYSLDNIESTSSYGGFSVGIASVLGDGSAESVTLGWGTTEQYAIGRFVVAY